MVTSLHSKSFRGILNAYETFLTFLQQESCDSSPAEKPTEMLATQATWPLKVFRYSFLGTITNFLNRLLDSLLLVRST